MWIILCFLCAKLIHYCLKCVISKLQIQNVGLINYSLNQFLNAWWQTLIRLNSFFEFAPADYWFWPEMAGSFSSFKNSCHAYRSRGGRYALSWWINYLFEYSYFFNIISESISSQTFFGLCAVKLKSNS